MVDENQFSTKLPNINNDERDWLVVMLAFFKPNKVYEPFLQEFPRLAEYADEHDISDDDLKTTIINRLYEMNRQPDRATKDLIGNLKNVQTTNIVAFANDVIFSHFVPMDVLLHIRDMIIEAAKQFDSASFAKEDATLKDFLAVFEKYVKIITYLRKSGIDVHKYILPIQMGPTEAEVVQIQAKQTQSPGDVDWQDESWLAGGENESK